MGKSFVTRQGTIIDFDSDFLICIEKEKERMYVLHREFPRCLIFIEPSTPLNFIVLDFFEMEEKEEEAIKIFASENFRRKVRDFVISQSFDGYEFN